MIKENKTRICVCLQDIILPAMTAELIQPLA